MAQQRSSGGVYLWLVTASGLGLVWGAIVTSFPSQQELAAVDPPRAAAQGSLPATVPTLDLTLPTSPPLPSDDQSALQKGPTPAERSHAGIPAETAIDSPFPEVVKLKCEAEIEQFCPTSLNPPPSLKSIKQRTHNFALPVNLLIGNRFEKGREERKRMMPDC